jgi:hypothetical protein
LIVIGLAFCGVGYLGLVAPQALLGPVGIEWSALGNSAQNELTATYGGMHAALGLFFLIAAFVPTIRLGALLAAATFMMGLVMGRVVSLVRDGIPGPMPLALILVELMGVLITLGAVLKRHAPVPAAAAPAPSPVGSPPPPL